MRFVWTACALLAAACATPPPPPPTTDPGPYPGDHGQLFSAYLAAVLPDAASAQVTLLTAPVAYAAAPTPLSPAVNAWAACYSVNPKGARGAFTGARSYMALFRGGSLYDVIVDETRTSATVRQEVARLCAGTGATAAPADATLKPSVAAPSRPPTPSKTNTASARAPMPVHPDGRPVIPGVLTTTETSGSNRGNPTPAGQYAYAAEQVARRMKCTFNSASLVGKGPGYETYGVSCGNEEMVVIRCDQGNCRALR